MTTALCPAIVDTVPIRIAAVMFPLRVRSYYSLMRGTVSPKQLCRKAAEYGYRGLALTDRNNLYGLWPFVNACKNEGLKPIVGAELSDSGNGRIVTCLVKDEAGYRNLCNLLSCSPDHGLDLGKDLAECNQGLLLLVDELELLRQLSGSGADVVADLGPRPTGRARELYQWAKRNGVPAVATPDSSIGEGEQQLYNLLRAIDTNSGLEKNGDVASVNCLEQPWVYRDRFDIWPEVLGISEQLASRCHFTGPEWGTVMPPWQGASSGEDDATALRRESYEGARRRYGDDLGEPVVERLEHELKVIDAMGFSSYFLVVRDIIYRKGKDGKRTHRRICGRGSGAASLVAYCLGVTNVCPLKYNLYFERFLNPGRTDPPDIDIDFAWDERDQVLAEVLGDYPDSSAMVCNHIFFQPRMAIRETAKAFGLPGGEISSLTKRLPWVVKGDSRSLLERLQDLPSLKDQDFSEPWPEILELSEKLIGIPRHLSVHPGGVVITPGKIRDYVPVEYAAKGVPIIQWEKDGAEEAGLVKIDILGNRSLGVVRDSLDSVAVTGDPIDEIRWNPEDDPRTMSGVARGTTMGCFYIESPAMRLLQQKAGSGHFEQLVIQSSIIRPAANEFVREYVRRLHGGTWQPLHPLVGDVLDETYGLMVYQEDVSRVAVAMAGFSHARADGLRKVMSKKDKELRLKDYRQRFYDGCRGKGVANEDIDRVWQMMMSFDGYSFCKPHSASYARVSYQAAYLKHHHPAEFMAAVISNQGGFYSTFAYVSEAKRLGIEILHPDVNLSNLRWKGRNGKVRVGLQSIAGLSGKCIERLLARRQQRPFNDSVDFWNRVLPSDDEARNLIHAGAMDSLDPQGNRTSLLWQWDSFRRARQQAGLNSLFEVRLPLPPPLQPPDRLSCLRREYGVLGFLCCVHPIRLIRNLPRRLVKMAEVPNNVGRRIQCAGWLLTGKLVSTKTGEAMEFLTFEDDTGMLETTFFPEAYKRSAHLLRTGRPYLLTGLVEEDYGAVTLTVERAEKL
ncbi:DNA polymerase III subunit alpha [Desulfopila sp. IMCC35008]|uniref:DNA polymerase III subunit alpha n=1 Tax=Desulfopila sp. IMCC35008 TaxID=2653858 RepID=UPI001F0F44A5|nr:DNA polymerase III subunit alpha [Desulfopila sp. IMCC35008]